MPYYAIHCIDKPSCAELRAQTRAAHLAHIGAVGDDLLVAGPLLDEAGGAIGSLLIVDFEDRTAALRFAAEDPYAKAGLFGSVAVTAWRRTHPA